jgi:hypothetical protein
MAGLQNPILNYNLALLQTHMLLFALSIDFDYFKT